MRDFIREIIKDAGEMAETYFVRGVEHKTKAHLADLLTEADLAVSDFLVQQISEKYPDHMIVTEELDEPINPGADYEWVIDPIDGTRNFAFGISNWGVIIAVLYKGETMYGAMYLPVANQLYFAEKGQGAYMNDMPMKVSEKDNFDYAVIHGARSFGNAGPYGEEVERYQKMMLKFSEGTETWIQHHGSMMGMCYMASGAVDGFFQNAGLDHDYLGPVLIAREAGAVVTDSYGNPWKRGRQDIVAANPKLHPQIMEFFE